jgi:hypothetical protein
VETFQEDPNLFDPRNLFAGDEKTPVQFYMGAMPAPKAESEAAGHPVFYDMEYIRIFNSKDNIIDRPVRDTDKKRWPAKYAAWKQSGASEPGGGGWKLEAWPVMSRAQVEEFKYFKVFTVEQLAEMPDSVGQKLMGFTGLKQKARQALQLAQENAPMEMLQMELKRRDETITEMLYEFKKMRARLDELEGNAKPRKKAA